MVTRKRPEPGGRYFVVDWDGPWSVFSKKKDAEYGLPTHGRIVECVAMPRVTSRVCSIAVNGITIGFGRMTAEESKRIARDLRRALKGT